MPNLLNPGDPIDLKVSEALSMARDHVHNTDGLAIIYFPAGTYYLSQPIELSRTEGDSNMVFQGDGSENTTLVFQVGDNINFNCFDIKGEYGSPADLNRNFNKRDSVFYAEIGQLSSLTTIPPDNWVHLYKYNFDYGVDENDREKKIVGQIERLVDKSQYDDFAEIEDEANKDYIDSVDPNYSLKVAQVRPVHNIGIEDLTVSCNPDGKASEPGKGIIFKFEHAVNCWVKGVESHHPSRHHLSATRCSHLEISGCYFHHAVEYCGGGYGYGVSMYGSTTHCLIENNCFRRLRHAMVSGGGANGNVWTFNYSREQLYTLEGKDWSDDPTTRDLDLHAKYPFGNLYEHNWIKGIGADDCHGNNGPYNAFLRNAIYNDVNDNWGKIILKNCPQTSVLGCELNHHIELHWKFQ